MIVDLGVAGALESPRAGWASPLRSRLGDSRQTTIFSAFTAVRSLFELPPTATTLEDGHASLHRWILCGAVRIEVAAAAYRVGICHCVDCRKRQGAIFHCFAVFPRDAVTVTGETRAFQSRHFCPICGSPLFDRFGDELELHAGCLDAANQVTPTYESWVVRREG